MKSTHINFPALLSLSVALVAAYCQNPSQDGQWTPLVQLRDTSTTFAGNAERPRPSDGWWVTPIHASLLSDGKVLITGWGRAKQEYCEAGMGRQNGTTFLLDPESLNVPEPSVLTVDPIPENPKQEGDVLYCSGKAPLLDGRVFFVGGARYENLDAVGPPFMQKEYGLNYARVYDPHTKVFSVIPFNAPGGPHPTLKQQKREWSWYEQGMMWYPTATRLPEGKVLVTGGYVRWDSILERKHLNYVSRTLTVFDPSNLNAGHDPWKILVAHKAGRSELLFDVFDYLHSFLLPQPVTINGWTRQVAFYGGGKNTNLGFLTLDENTPENKRVATTKNAHRPIPGNVKKHRASDTTAALVATGEIMIMGGGDRGTIEGTRIDLYNPQTDSWRSVDTGITRIRAASLLLPDGTVLILNGERFYKDEENVGDRREPTIFDPHTNTVKNLAPWPNDPDDRGYHNIALLLKDGRVLVGGGRTLVKNWNHIEQHRIGCERSDVRIFSPPYLFKGIRPVIQEPGDALNISIGDQPFALDYTGPTLRENGGVVLMALGAETHHFDQNQRYISLAYSVTNKEKLIITPPVSEFVAPEGDYILFLISADGVPSIGKSVHLTSMHSSPAGVNKPN